MPLQTIIDIAIQIAEALNAAHKKNVIHRDIKSENIMVTETGQIKVMDFGLAKLKGSIKLTKTSSTVGTVAYMSPEQARGEQIDHRTDIWSLGVVLYEMISGELPFKGDYESAVFYSILNEDPASITGLRTGVPMELERIINKALTKNPDERYQHVDDLMVDIEILRKSIESDEKEEPFEVRKIKTSSIRGKKYIKLYGIFSAIVFVIIFLFYLYFVKWHLEFEIFVKVLLQL